MLSIGDPAPDITQLDGLNFALLSDVDRAVAEAYGVWQEKNLAGNVSMGIVPSAFLIGTDGTLEQVWSKISPKNTPVRLIEAAGS